MNLGLLNSSEKRELILLLEEKKRRDSRNKLKFYKPYVKQYDFHAAGKEHHERLFMAGNQLGKTWAGGFETAIHLTGRYPDWWPGKEFQEPPRFWVAGVTNEATRDNPQRILVGPPQIRDQWGTAAIPGDAIKDFTTSRGTPDALDSVVVKFGGGGDIQAGESICVFKSYEKGREKWQGETLDGVWFDEEPPAPIYSEGRTRTNKKGIFTYLTFTPLLGMSEVVRQFLSEDELAKV